MIVFFEEMPIFASIITLSVFVMIFLIFFFFDGIVSIITLSVFVMIFFIFDKIASIPVPFYGKVLDKHYQAESNQTGTGIAMTGSGKMGVVMTSETEPEKFLLMVETTKGKVFTVKCSPKLFYSKNKGDDIECYYSKGYFTKMIYSKRGVR